MYFLSSIGEVFTTEEVREIFVSFCRRRGSLLRTLFNVGELIVSKYVAELINH